MTSSDDEESKKAAASKKALAAAKASAKPLMMMPRTSSVPIQYPMLTDTNYVVWATKMKFILRNLRVWKAIEGTEMRSTTRLTRSPWLLSRKRARAQVLKRQLNKLEMLRGETIAEYSVKITNLVSEIKSLGGKVTDTEVIEKLFSSVTENSQILSRRLSSSVT
jgi:hypothetical protein